MIGHGPLFNRFILIHRLGNYMLFWELASGLFQLFPLYMLILFHIVILYLDIS